MKKSSESSGKFGLDSLILFCVGLVAALILGWVIFPAVLYSSQPQPINFSHALHMDPDRVFGISGETKTDKCLFCHRFREDGTFAGIPGMEDCFMCHSDPEFPLGESEEEKKFLEEYVATGKEVPWLSYFKQPDCVYFSHIAHVKMGEIGCERCHGDHGDSAVLPEYEENRLTGYSRNIWGPNISGLDGEPWEQMKMDDCADCHTEMGEEQNNACAVCHK